VLGSIDRIKLGLSLSERVRLAGPYTHQGAMTKRNEFGYEAAIQMVFDVISILLGRFVPCPSKSWYSNL
jgi:hypothetical protein